MMMLRELRIENLLLIERTELRFDEGLNAITGETGAGKTLVGEFAVQLAIETKEQLVETRFAPEAFNQDKTVQQQLDESLRQIDQFPSLSDLLRDAPASAT